MPTRIKTAQHVLDKHQSESALTDLEREILDHLSKAYDAFVFLGIQHPMHQLEFTLAIHAAQRLILSRPTSRDEGLVITQRAFDEFSVRDIVREEMRKALEELQRS